MGLELAKMWVRVRADDTGMQQDLAKTKARVSNMGAGIGLSMRGIALGAGAAALAIGALTVKHGIGLAADLETTTIAFETMLGSAGAAKKMMADLTQFAAATPFELPQIQQATKVLLSFGITQDKILPTLRTLGDVSAGTGKDFGDLAVIFGQVKAKGKLMGGELLQFSEAGVPMVAQLAKQFGVAESRIAKMSEQGKISFAAVEKALASMSAEGGIFFDLMKRQSTTVTGLWSTWKDSANKNLRDIFTALTPLTQAILTASIKMTDAFGNAFSGVSGGMAIMAKGLADWLIVISENWDLTWKIMQQSAVVQMAKVGDFFSVWEERMTDIRESPLMTLLHGHRRGLFDESFTTTLIKDELDRLKGEFKTKMDAIKAGRALEGDGPEKPPLPPQMIPNTANEFSDLRGRSGFAELGRKMQDALMKKTDDNQLKMIALMEAGNAKQDELIKAVRDKPVAQVGLQ